MVRGKVRELGHEVYLSHPKQTKAIASARLKSDKVDALMLARLLKADLLPMVWMPGEKERYVRELLTHRGRLVRSRTAVINELHAVYAKRNMEVVWIDLHRPSVGCRLEVGAPNWRQARAVAPEQ